MFLLIMCLGSSVYVPEIPRRSAEHPRWANPDAERQLKDVARRYPDPTGVAFAV